MIIALDTIKVENIQIFRENNSWKIGFNITLSGGSETKAVSVSYMLTAQQMQNMINFLKPFVRRLKTDMGTPKGEEWADN